VTCVDNEDNELVTLETIHHFVEVLDRYFGNVSAVLVSWLSVTPTNHVPFSVFLPPGV
jgi:Clathrin adaptor complex small chain